MTTGHRRRLAKLEAVGLAVDRGAEFRAGIAAAWCAECDRHGVPAIYPPQPDVWAATVARYQSDLLGRTEQLREEALA